MNFTGRASCADDRAGITALMKENLDLPPGSTAIEPSLQDWKYWQPHPLFTASRSYVIHDNGKLVSHGGRWPIRLSTASGVYETFHLIDWVADRSANGAGMKLLQECASGHDAVFSVGGSDAGQKVVAAFGFKPANPVWTLSRPLRAWSAHASDSKLDWKFPARLIRSAVLSVYPRAIPNPEWQCIRVAFSEIPESLYPTPTAHEAVSARNASLLSHLASCPQFSAVHAYLLAQSGRPAAYFVLAQTGREVRLLDFGPAGLDHDAAHMLGTYTQLSARSDFRDATALVTITTEISVRQGLVRSGLRVQREKIVRILRLNPALREIQTFRLTMIDWDAAYL